MSISDSIRIAAGLVLTAIEYIVGQIGTMKEKNIMTACLAVIQYNGEWGFRTLERLHYSIYSQSWWDLVPTVTYYLINKNGVTGQVWPYGLAAVINGWAAANMAYFYSTFIGAFGNGNWVQLGTYIPLITLTTIDQQEIYEQLSLASDSATILGIIQDIIIIILGFL